MKKHEEVIKRLQDSNTRYWAGDNISEHLKEGDQELLIDEATEAFEGVLDALVIDRFNDPNSHGTARRLAKMYYKEIMEGRYVDMPNATAFPNHLKTDIQACWLCVVNLKVCVHITINLVAGVAYIGIIAGEKLIGLSKYTRIAQWCARRGTLQEELCNNIAREIQRATGSENVGVYIQATHGCCENRGIMATSSLTQTTVLRGAFKDDAGTKKNLWITFICNNNMRVVSNEYRNQR